MSKNYKIFYEHKRVCCGCDVIVIYYVTARLMARLSCFKFAAVTLN